MKQQLRLLVRSLLVFLPFSQELKPLLQRIFFKTFKIAFEPEFEALQLFPDTNDAVYLDIGGNRGFAIDAMKMFKPSCCVYSFEPNPLLANKTSKHFRNNNLVKVFTCGLGNEEGEFKLFIPAYRNFIFYPLASFNKERAESWLQDGIILV